MAKWIKHLIFRHGGTNNTDRTPPASPTDEWPGHEERLKRFNSLPRIPGVEHDYDRKISIYIDPLRYVENRDWRKQQMLGCGGFGKCYQALDVVTGTLMAVKQIPISGFPDVTESSTNAIREEIELLGRLNHANIVRLLGATEERSHINIFMEWMPGGSVRSLLDKFGPFHESVIIKYIKQVLTGLAYLHDNKILHRDLKGDNILINGTGQHVRITDFGNAKCLRAQTTNVTGGDVTGTLPFMAPEVVRGPRYGRSCDIWSVGCVIIEMTTGRHPWDTGDNKDLNYFALLFKIGRSPPPFPAGLTNSTRSLVQKCLVMNPLNRPRAKDLLQHPCFAIHDNNYVSLTTFMILGSSSSSDLSTCQYSNNSSSDGTVGEIDDDDEEEEEDDFDDSDMFHTATLDTSNLPRLIFDTFNPEESEDI